MAVAGSPLLRSVLTAGLCTFAVTEVRTQVPSPLRLTVRVHDLARRAVAERAEAAGVATESLRSAGVQVTWRDCSLAADHSPQQKACDAPLATDEVVLRLVDAPALTPIEVLGFSFVDVRNRAGTLATVYPDRIAVVADAAGIAAGELLGYAIAHELVHLLAGSRSHSKEGLMQARWDVPALRRSSPRLWTIAAREAAAMRRGLAARLAGPALLLAQQNEQSRDTPQRSP